MAGSLDQICTPEIIRLRLELNLEPFNLSYRYKDRLVKIFCAARDLVNIYGYGVLPENIMLWTKHEMTVKEFKYLYDFLIDIGVFKEGKYIEINADCEFLICTDLVD